MQMAVFEKSMSFNKCPRLTVKCVARVITRVNQLHWANRKMMIVMPRTEKKFHYLLTFFFFLHRVSMSESIVCVWMCMYTHKSMYSLPQLKEETFMTLHLIMNAWTCSCFCPWAFSLIVKKGIAFHIFHFNPFKI